MPTLRRMTTAREPIPTADEAFGLAVNQAMFRQRVSRKKLAATLQCHPTTVGKKLQGERPWSLTDMIQTADALRVDLKDLLDDMWRDGTPSSGAAWAPRDSNPQPTDYKLEPSPNVTSIIHWRKRHDAERDVNKKTA